MTNHNDKKRSKIKLNIVLRKDYENLINFLINFENEHRDYSFWLNRIKHWWDDNPAYDESLIRGWYLTNNQNNIVGFIGCIPSLFQLNHQQEIAFSATTWRVDSKYRKQSLLLFSKLLKQSSESILFDTTPSKDVIKILNGFKFRLFPNQNNQIHLYLYVINFQNLFKDYVSKNTFVLLFLKPVFKALDLLQDLITDKSEISENTVEVFSAGEEFDYLWERSKNTYENTNIRNSEAINWQCFSKKDSKKLLFGYFEKEKLRGFVVYNSVTTENSRMLVLNDIWGLNLDSSILKDFYLAAKQYGKKNGYDVILFNSFNEKQNQLLSKMRYFKRRKNDLRFYKSNIDLEEGSSYLSLLQGDYGL